MKAFTPVVFLAVCLTSVSARQWDVTAQLRGPLAPIAVNVPNVPVARAEELYGRSAVITKASDASFPAIRLTLPKGTIKLASARKSKRDLELAELFLRSFVDDSNIFARSDKPKPLTTQPQPHSGITGAFDNLGAGTANFGNSQGSAMDALLSGTVNSVGTLLSPKKDDKTKKTRRDLADFVVRSLLAARDGKDDKPKPNPRPDQTTLVKINNEIRGGEAKGKRN